MFIANASDTYRIKNLTTMPTILLDIFTSFPQKSQKNERYFVVQGGAVKTSSYGGSAHAKHRIVGWMCSRADLNALEKEKTRLY
jgi:hypothetical protein